jgi:HTH DNA binding domain
MEDDFTALLADPDVRLVACRPSPRRSERRLVRWLELETASPAGRERLRALTLRAGARNLSVSAPASHRALVRLSSPLPAVCSAVFTAGAICATCPLLAPGRSERSSSVRLVVPRNGEAQRLRQELSRTLDSALTIERTGERHPPARMTRRQEEAFRMALELGYFAYPRRADLGALARRLGVSRSTALELLRHAVEDVGRRRFSPGATPAERL